MYGAVGVLSCSLDHVTDSPLLFNIKVMFMSMSLYHTSWSGLAPSKGMWPFATSYREIYPQKYGIFSMLKNIALNINLYYQWSWALSEDIEHLSSLLQG